MVRWGVCVYGRGRMKVSVSVYPWKFLRAEFSFLPPQPETLSRGSGRRGKKTAESQTVKLWKICQSWLYDCVTRLFSLPGGGGLELERGGGGQEANWKKNVAKLLVVCEWTKDPSKVCNFHSSWAKWFDCMCWASPQSSQNLRMLIIEAISSKFLQEKKYQLKIAIVLSLSLSWRSEGEIVLCFLQLLYHIHARNITSFMLVCQLKRIFFYFYFSFSSGTLIWCYQDSRNARALTNDSFSPCVYAMLCVRASFICWNFECSPLCRSRGGYFDRN